MMIKLCIYFNVGGVLFVFLGCEGFNCEYLSEVIS